MDDKEIIEFVEWIRKNYIKCDNGWLKTRYEKTEPMWGDIIPLTSNDLYRIYINAKKIIGG